MHGSGDVVPTTKCFWSCARACAGESQFVTRFRNDGGAPAIVGLAVPVPNAKVELAVAPPLVLTRDAKLAMA